MPYPEINVDLDDMWRFLGSRFVVKAKEVVSDCRKGKFTRLFSIKSVRSRYYLSYNAVGSLALAGAFATWYQTSYHGGVLSTTFDRASCEEHYSSETHSEGNTITLYQYASCPFCNKVRAFLDYYGVDYSIVEVDPLFKKEIKFSEYKKVPILIIKGVQLNDSSLIISMLSSYLLKQDTIEQLMTYYPPITSSDSHGKTITEYGNRYNIMYKTDFDESRLEEIKKERKWRKWVDDTFIHTLSPNIYRTWREAMEASEYFSGVGDFSATQRFLAKYVGAVVMYYIGRKMKKKYRLKDDVRESMYDEAKIFTKALGKRKFMGGKQPNLADLAMFGVLRGIEGLNAVDDLKQHTDIKPWFDRMKHAVETHQGAALLPSTEIYI